MGVGGQWPETNSASENGVERPTFNTHYYTLLRHNRALDSDSCQSLALLVSLSIPARFHTTTCTAAEAQRSVNPNPGYAYTLTLRDAFGRNFNCNHDVVSLS